jgi:hypothetical protein
VDKTRVAGFRFNSVPGGSQEPTGSVKQRAKRVSQNYACMDMTEPSIWYLSEAKVQKFVSGAPEAVVNAERTKLATQQDIIAKNEAALKELK